MTMHRRDFVKLGSAASFVAALGLPALGENGPTAGLIFLRPMRSACSQAG